VFAAFKGKYGAPRLDRELCRQRGYTGSYERVRVLMRALGLKARAGRKYKVTTDSAHALPIAPNLLGQDFIHTHASAPNQVWLSDITPAYAGAGSTCGRKRVGCSWLACSICSPVKSWAGQSIRT
jgi:putative transposase